ncbi:hypothetical protein IQ06DRAFT_288932 [Phaeosphaeriaceae sp. SRC1lsM3a]|nr:hypothetical protein IQ06DRAFT_288932 [Stagonospora sp. SRC1lsM3a]
MAAQGYYQGGGAPQYPPQRYGPPATPIPTRPADAIRRPSAPATNVLPAATTTVPTRPAAQAEEGPRLLDGVSSDAVLLFRV